MLAGYDRIIRALVFVWVVVRLLLPSSGACAAGLAGYQYVSPLPGSRMVSPWNNIVIRHGDAVDRGSLDARRLQVSGSRSGNHRGELVLSNDGKTLVFLPDQPFALGETVSVSFQGAARRLSEEALPGASFSFTVAAVDPQLQPLVGFHGPPATTLPPTAPPTRPEADAASTMSACDTLPTTYPNISLTTTGDVGSDHFFIAPYGFGTRGGHLMILDPRAETVFYRRFSSYTTDFKLQPSGLISYFYSTSFQVIDSSYTVVGSWRPGNGYNADAHELQLLPNGHALLFGYDPEPVRMDSVVAGGDSNATVIGLIVQELDAAKNVIFQWRSWDHFEITDADPSIDLTAPLVDYVHGNAIEVDHDGNLLISSRHLNEITKIDRLTGDVMWRMGLNAKNNEFTFVNDPRGFAYQHDVRRLPNGNITLFDNGNVLSPLYSRAVEYQLDEVNKIATQVWEYRYTPDILGPSLGSVQRHANGTMISWGGTPDNPKATDLHGDDSIAFELGLDSNLWTYRAFRFPWETTRFTTDEATLDFGFVAVGDSATLPLTVRHTSAEPLNITCFKSLHPDFTVSAPVPQILETGETLVASVTYKPTVGGLQESALYVRALETYEFVARSVELRGIGSGLVAARDAPLAFRLYAARPNPFRATTTIAFDLPRAEHVTLEAFDVFGRKVKTLVDGVRPAGRHRVSWKPEAMKNGLFFYRLRAGTHVATRKLAYVN